MLIHSLTFTAQAAPRFALPHLVSRSDKAGIVLKLETEMPDFDVEGFIAEMDRLGLKLTAVPLADGKYLVNRWRMSGAFEHAKQIEKLWISQIGNNQSRIDQLAAHLLAQAQPRVIANRIFPHR